MAQNPLAATVAKNPSNQQTPLSTDAAGSLRANAIPGNTALGISANTVVKSAPGRVGTANVVVGGSTAGGIYDCLTTAAIGTTNQIAVLPPLTSAQVSALTINMVAKLGITVIPGTGQTVNVAFE